MSQVIDASVVLAALVDAGEPGRWARDMLAEGSHMAPHVLPVEVTSGLRRLVAKGLVSADSATSALQDLAGLDVDLFAFAPFANRVWELRESVTAYDAWYVALAEASTAPLATLDARLVRAAGPRCTFSTNVSGPHS